MDNKVTIHDVLRMAEESSERDKIRKVKEDTDDLQETMDKYDEYLVRRDKLITSTSTKSGDLFFKGYRPNFYFRTNDPVMEKPLSESIIEAVEKVIKDDKSK